MAKVMAIVMIVVGIFALFTLFGLTNSTTTSQLLTSIAFDSPSGLSGADLFWQVFGSAAGIIATASLAGVILVGLFRSFLPIQYVTAGFTATLAGWIIGDMVSLLGFLTTATEGATWASGPIKVVFMMIIAGTIIALVSWWQGGDS